MADWDDIMQHYEPKRTAQATETPRQWEPSAEQVERWARVAYETPEGGLPDPGVDWSWLYPSERAAWMDVARAVAVEVARELRGALERAHAQAAADQATAERWMNALGLMTRERDALLAEVVALRKGLQARLTPAGEEGAR